MTHRAAAEAPPRVRSRSSQQLQPPPQLSLPDRSPRNPVIAQSSENFARKTFSDLDWIAEIWEISWTYVEKRNQIEILTPRVIAKCERKLEIGDCVGFGRAATAVAAAATAAAAADSRWRLRRRRPMGHF